jgi:hypothetical protein
MGDLDATRAARAIAATLLDTASPRAGGTRT